MFRIAVITLVVLLMGTFVGTIASAVAYNSKVEAIGHKSDLDDDRITLDLSNLRTEVDAHSDIDAIHRSQIHQMLTRLTEDTRIIREDLKEISKRVQL